MKASQLFAAPEVEESFTFSQVMAVSPLGIMVEVAGLKWDDHETQRLSVRTAFLFDIDWVEAGSIIQTDTNWVGSVWLDGRPFMAVQTALPGDKPAKVTVNVTDQGLYRQAVAYIQNAAGATHRKLDLAQVDAPCPALQELYGAPRLEDLVRGTFSEGEKPKSGRDLLIAWMSGEPEPEDNRPRPDIRPADLYALSEAHPRQEWEPPLETTLQHEYHGQEICPELLGVEVPWEKNERVTARRIFYHDFDGRRTVSVYTLWWDENPFGIVSTGGRDVEKDHVVVVTTDEAAYFEAVSYLQSLAGVTHRQLHHSELPDRGEELSFPFSLVDLRRREFREDQLHWWSRYWQNPQVVVNPATDEDSQLRKERLAELGQLSVAELEQLLPWQLVGRVSKRNLVTAVLCHEGFPVTATEAERAMWAL